MSFISNFICCVFLTSLLLGWASKGDAAATITFSQVGNDVTATISGSLDVRSLTRLSGQTSNGRVRGTPTNLQIGPVIDPVTVTTDLYPVSGPTNIGVSATNISANSGTGTANEMFGVNMASPSRVLVPVGFTNGTVNASSTWTGQSISSLGLTPGTYTYTWTGDLLTVVIPAAAPTATTNAASSITTTGATLNGAVSSNGAQTTVAFDYGLTTGYGSTATAAQSPLPSNASSAAVSAVVTGLTCNTLYHYRVNANNGTGGTINGSDATFTTSTCPAPTLSITNTPQTYTGSPISAAVSCQGGGAVSNVQYNGSLTVPTNAATYAVTANCAASTNYSALTDASAGSFVISPATQATLIVVSTPSSLNVNTSSSLSTTGGSGNGAVTYSLVSGPCTLPVGTAILTGTGAGSCVVTATKAADANYNAIASAPVTVTVAGPPPVLNLVATPGPGYIRLDFSSSTPALAAASSTVQPSSSVIYTGTCVSSDGGTTASATGPNSPLTVTGVTAGRLYTCTVIGTDGSGSSAPSNPSNAVTPVPPPSPTKPIPTLSEWAQILMMLMMIATAGFYGWRMKQR